MYKHFTLLLSIFFFLQCNNFEQSQITLQELCKEGKYQEADNFLNLRKKKFKKNKLLYCLNRGLLNYHLGKYELSNQFFEKAYIIHQHFEKKMQEEIASLLTNPNAKTYKPEDHEVFLLHYYKILNYLALNQINSALIECKRIEIKLYRLKDRYNGNEVYNQDAFMHLLMGIVYQASDDYNNAFIAYRNAYNIYENVYEKLFGILPPEQLKKDLIYTAYKNQFEEEMQWYQRKFNMQTYDPRSEASQHEIICFWNNGLAPIKESLRFDFLIIPEIGLGGINFQNSELGLCIPVPLPGNSPIINFLDKVSPLSITLPQYKYRNLYYSQASILVNQTYTYNFEEIENIEKIAVKLLKQRLGEELGSVLLRISLKKAAELQIRNHNELVGKLFGVMNMLIERADIRSWQNIPHSIYYTRARVVPGKHTLSFSSQSFQHTRYLKTPIQVDLSAVRTVFYAFNSTEYEE